MFVDEIEVRELHDADEIDAAKHLVFQVYAFDNKWQPAPDNLSGWHVERIGERNIFVDDYDEVATWYGAYQGGDLVGCCRTCARRNGLLEFERYVRRYLHWYPERYCERYQSLLDCIAKERRAREVNRSAVKRDFRASVIIFVKLRRLIVRSALQNMTPLFLTNDIDDIAKYEKIGMQRYNTI